MQSLYELQKEKELERQSVDLKKREEIISKYREDLDLEIGYQKYYNFLTHDFYDFITRFLNNYGEGRVTNIGDCDLAIPIDKDLLPFVRSFLSRYNLGFISDKLSVHSGYLYIYDWCIIKINGENIKQVMQSYYTELQSIEYLMKSPEEMQADLESFTQNNSEWLAQKIENDRIKALEDEQISILEDSYYDDCYYKKLEQLLNLASSHMKTRRASNRIIKDDFIIPNVHNYYDESTNSFAPFLEFITDYHLGYHSYDVNAEVAYIYLNATPHQIYNACMMELQRLAYYKAEEQSDARK